MYSEIPVEVEVFFVTDLQFLDLLNYAHVARQSRSSVLSLLTLRTIKLLRPYFTRNDIQGFWEALDSSEGGITGSAPLWVTQCNPSWTPADLNAIVAANRGPYLRNFLLRRGWTEENMVHRIPIVLPAHSLTHSLRAYAAGSAAAATTTVFRKKGRKPITLTETSEEAVFPTVAGAKHSMATMLLTSTTIMALHPRDCVKKYYTFRAGAGLPRDEHSTAAARAYTMGGSENYFNEITLPCGGNCPGVLRRLRGGDGIGLLRWNAGPSARLSESAYAGFFEDKFSTAWTWAKCRNSRCPTFGFPWDIISTLPRSVKLSANAKENQILRTAHAVQHSSPPFTRIYFGLLFATSCGAPVVVPVPLDHGRRQYHTLDDLRAYTWIMPRRTNIELRPVFMTPYQVIGSTADLIHLGWRENLDGTRALLIFMSGVKDLGPVNDCIGGSKGFKLPVRGDVLLMLESNGGIVDVGSEDSEYLKDVFTRVWKKKLEGEHTGTAEIR